MGEGGLEYMKIECTKCDMVSKMYMADVSSRACSIYLYLYQRCYNKESCFPSIKTICADTKLSRSTVKRAISDLEKAGFLIKQRRFRENGGNSSNEYILGANA